MPHGNFGELVPCHVRDLHPLASHPTEGVVMTRHQNAVAGDAHVGLEVAESPLVRATKCSIGVLDDSWPRRSRVRLDAPSGLVPRESDRGDGKQTPMTVSLRSGCACA